MTRKIQTIKQKVRQEEYWHTGTPKESGFYVGIDYGNENNPYVFWVDDSDECNFADLKAWHKIPKFST